MALPALALGWLLVASAPAIKYKASARVESVVRTVVRRNAITSSSASSRIPSGTEVKSVLYASFKYRSRTPSLRCSP